MMLLLLQLLLAVGCFFYFGGVAPAGDQGRYIFGAENLIYGRPLIERQASYFSYLLILVFFKKVGLSLIWVVVFQWVLSAVALVVLHKLSSRFSSYPANLLGPFLFLFTDIQRWSQNILTDSVYISCAIIVVYLLTRITEETVSWPLVFSTIFLGVFTVFVRPNGWSFIPILPLSLFFIPGISKIKKAGIIFFCCTLIFTLAASVSTHSEGQERYLGWTALGEVIWSFPGARISMPQPTSDLQGTSGLFQYIYTYPFSYLKLFFLRVFTEVSHYRVFYSNLHNTVSIIFLTISYSFAAIGLIFHRRGFLPKITIALCLLHMGIIGITFADWDGRFLMHFFPLLLPFVSAGLSVVQNKFILPPGTQTT